MHFRRGGLFPVTRRGVRDGASATDPHDQDRRQMKPGWPPIHLPGSKPDPASSRWFSRPLSSVQLQHVTLVLCTLAVIAYNASAFLPIPHGYRDLRDCFGGAVWRT